MVDAIRKSLSCWKWRESVWRLSLGPAFLVILLLGLVPREGKSQQSQQQGQQPNRERLTDMSLEQLGKIEVTTLSKEPEEVW